MKPAKNPTASEMGRKGGLARFARMTPQQKSDYQRKVANARWSKRKLQTAAA